MKMKAIILLCACSLLSMTACSGKEEQPEMVVENLDELNQSGNSNPAEETEPESDAEETKEPGNSDNETGNESSTGEESMSEEKNIEILEGSVESIGTGSVIICKSYTYEEEDGLVMVSSADESGNKTLVTVNLPEGVKWELRTVKNGGVNGDSDVTLSEASISDIKEGIGVKFTGYYVTEEKEFTAESVVIYNFV
ncbi:MAG: hypothetical protein K2G19_11325 [Lachnospiraceae bacterium]|nr:hypothetical protein [Lachnospiraceae bacterium]